MAKKSTSIKLACTQRARNCTPACSFLELCIHVKIALGQHQWTSMNAVRAASTARSAFSTLACNCCTYVLHSLTYTDAILACTQLSHPAYTLTWQTWKVAIGNICNLCFYACFITFLRNWRRTCFYAFYLQINVFNIYALVTPHRSGEFQRMLYHGKPRTVSHKTEALHLSIPEADKLAQNRTLWINRVRNRQVDVANRHGIK